MGDQDIPHGESSDVYPGPPEGDHGGTPAGDNGAPPLYIHPGTPDDAQESPISDKDIAGVHQGIPILPLTGLQEGDRGGPGSTLSPELAEALTVVWPELVQLLDWWRARQQYTQEPTERLERVTWHVAPRWIEAVRREADQTRQTYAAIVNTALAIYFRGKST